MNYKDKNANGDAFARILDENDKMLPEELIDLQKEYGKNSVLTKELSVGNHKLIWLDDDKIMRLSKDNLFIYGLWKISDTNPHDICCVNCVVEDDNSFTYTTFNGIRYHMKIIHNDVVLDHKEIVK